MISEEFKAWTDFMADHIDILRNESAQHQQLADRLETLIAVLDNLPKDEVREAFVAMKDAFKNMAERNAREAAGLQDSLNNICLILHDDGEMN